MLAQAVEFTRKDEDVKAQFEDAWLAAMSDLVGVAV